jgi:Glutamyl-tRNAGlu reductase, dimerisation domain
MGRLGDLSDRQRNAINALTVSIVNKMLHDPIVRLKERGGRHDARVYVHAVQELFGLPGSGDGARMSEISPEQRVNSAYLEPER